MASGAPLAPNYMQVPQEQQPEMQQPGQHQMRQLQNPEIDATFPSCSGCCLCCVPEGKVGVVQQCGAYVGFANPGPVWIIPCYHSITCVSIAVRQMMVSTDCKTKDDVTVTVVTAVQFFIQRDKIEEAMFIVERPEEQIRVGVNNVVRSEVPGLELDQAYENKDHLRDAVLEKLRPQMQEFGYYIRDVLITDLRPDLTVIQAMNQINVSKHQRQANIEQGEADKLLKVKKAEGEAQAKYLSGQGMSRMRIEIAKGFKESMDAMSAGGLTAKESMTMMITTQYVDMLKDFATNKNKTAIMVPTSGATNKGASATSSARDSPKKR